MAAGVELDARDNVHGWTALMQATHQRLGGRGRGRGWGEGGHLNLKTFPPQTSHHCGVFMQMWSKRAYEGQEWYNCCGHC